MRTTARFRAFSAACLVLLAAAGGVAGAFHRTPAAAATASDSTAPAFSQTETIARSFLSGGHETVVDSRTVTLNVSQTTNLQGRQEIAVSWSGAHPTGDIVPDPNSAEGEYEEYPFVLLECRGTPSGSSEVTPETCWTQDAASRYQEGFSYEPYQLDQYASSPGADVVGQPSALPSTSVDPFCQSEESGPGATPVRYWVPWVAADGTVYDGGEAGLCGVPPEATNGETAALPSNETYGVTGVDGTGSVEFDVLDSTENATMGCSASVACSLVAVPVMGVSCDADVSPVPSASQLAQCEETGAASAGSKAIGQQGEFPYDQTVSGFLWWSASNWRNRITVPLTFAQTPSSCPIVSSNNTVNVYGSEILLQATSQWEPYFCLGDDSTGTFTFNHVAQSEPVARNDLASGASDAAFTSYAQPLGYGKPVVNAPVGVTGFTISFSVDDASGDPVSTLKLTPLLLAKLLTDSYPVLGEDQANPALAGNPLNITNDPEFEALNPGIPRLGVGAFSAAELMSLSESSDVVEALTTYINDDPTARAWLNGTSSGEPAVCNAQGVYQSGATGACPGVVVNPAYKGMSLPVDQWPLLSTWESKEYDANPQVQYCLQDSPVPFDSILAAPLEDLQNLSESMQFHKANSTTNCTPDAPGVPNALGGAGTQSTGSYFMIGLTPLADNDRYGLQTAELETAPGAFVAPSDTSLQAATSLLQPDMSTGTWPIPYEAFQTAKGSAAYPGTMLVYAAVPTSGLQPAPAADLAALLTFAAGPGQDPGEGVGQLPPGYLPMTAADGLGGLAAYTLAAAADVRAQNGQIPSLTGPSGSGSASGSAGTVSPFAPDGVSGNNPVPSASLLLTPAATSAALGAKKEHKMAGLPKVSLVELPGILASALWTGGLPFGLIMLMALLVTMAVLTAYLVGRRFQRW